VDVHPSPTLPLMGTRDHPSGRWPGRRSGLPFGRVKAARSWLRRRPLAADGIVAIVVFALGILSDRIYYDIGAVNPHNFRFALGVAFMALLTLPLVCRRRLPSVTLACVTLSVLGYTVFGISEASITATVAFVAIYSVGAYCARPLANWVRGVCVALMFGDLVWMLLFRQIDLGHSKASTVGAGILSVGSNVFFFVAAWVIRGGRLGLPPASRGAGDAQRRAQRRPRGHRRAGRPRREDGIRPSPEVQAAVGQYMQEASVAGVLLTVKGSTRAPRAREWRWSTATCGSSTDWR
jgi:hypothetical protein